MQDASAQTSPVPARRGRKARPAVRCEELIGRKYLKSIDSYLQNLRKLYPHPNRKLFYDDVVVTYLLAFFNPILRSLRCIEDASQLPGINRFLNIEAVCRSTLSEANELFDPKHLEGLIQQLQKDLPNLKQIDGQLAALLDHVRVHDGSYFRVAADIAWALHQSKPNGKLMGQVRLNCQFCLANGCPIGVSVSGDDGIGEGAAAQKMIESDAIPGLIYLFDSGVVKFSLLRAINTSQSHFLCSLREHIGFTVERENVLSDLDRQAGVLSDRVGYLTSSHDPRGANSAPPILVREVLLHYIDRHGKPQTLRLLTDLLDLPGHLLVELYRYRWQIELFFRWLKIHANFQHLTSHSDNGVLLSFHIATIAMMLTCLHTQSALSKYGYNLLAMVAAGLGDLDDIAPILLRRENEKQRARARYAAKRAAKKPA